MKELKELGLKEYYKKAEEYKESEAKIQAEFTGLVLLHDFINTQLQDIIKNTPGYKDIDKLPRDEYTKTFLTIAAELVLLAKQVPNEGKCIFTSSPLLSKLYHCVMINLIITADDIYIFKY